MGRCQVGLASVLESAFFNMLQQKYSSSAQQSMSYQRKWHWVEVQEHLTMHLLSRPG